MNQDILLMTDAELSRTTGISRTTLWRLRKKGQLPYLQIGGKIAYRKKVVSDFLDGCERGQSHPHHRTE